MALLTPQEKQELLSTLTKLPFTRSFGERNLLITYLPDEVQGAISRAQSQMEDLNNIVTTTDGWPQLNDGTWPIIIMVRSVASFITGAKVEQTLLDLADRLEARANDLNKPLGDPTGKSAPSNAVPSGDRHPEVLVPSGPNMTTTTSGLQYLDTKPADGPIVVPGQSIFLNYRIALSMSDLLAERWIDEYEDDLEEKEPVIIKVGRGEVLRGVDEGLMGMRVGAARRLVLPPELAFGERGVPGIVPPNSSLYVDIIISTKSQVFLTSNSP
jgi:hypothetical protein